MLLAENSHWPSLLAIPLVSVGAAWGPLGKHT